MTRTNPLPDDDLVSLSRCLRRVADGEDLGQVQHAADLAGVGARFKAALDPSPRYIGRRDSPADFATADRQRQPSSLNVAIRDRSVQAAAGRVELFRRSTSPSDDQQEADQ